MFKKQFLVSVFNFTGGEYEVCIRNDKTVGSLGIWVGDNPFDFVLPVTLCQIMVVIVASRMLYYILRPLQPSKFICSVLGGILIGPTFLGNNHELLEMMFPLKQSSFLATLSKIGALYFVFITSLKVDVTMTLKVAKRCWKFAVIPFISSYFVHKTLIVVYKQNDDAGSVFLPNIFIMSSFFVVSEALSELKLLSTELGQIALSSAMIGDTMQWGTMLFRYRSKEQLEYSIEFLICLCLFILSIFYIIRMFMKRIVRRTPKGKPVKEMHIIIILIGVLVMAAISDVIGLHFIIGPLIYGLAMPNGPPLATTIIERSQTLVHEIFMPFFYVYIGINTNFAGLRKNWKPALVCQSILFIGFIVKVIACALVSPTYNIRRKHGMALGLILSIRGIIELIYFSRLKMLQIIDEEIFSQMVLYVVVMTSICMPLIKYLYKHRARELTNPNIHNGRVRTIQNTSEDCVFKVISCVHSDTNVHSMISLLEAFNPTRESPIDVHVIHFIELLGRSTSILLPMNMQNRRSLSINYLDTNHILRAFENYSNNSNGSVTILSYVNVAPYKHMHEAICNLAQDKLVHLLVLPFHENDQTLGDNVNISIRDLNNNFQFIARCTVGIIVDRCSRLNMSATKLSFHVGIFFLGGPDDREALALGIRMLNSERSNIKMTLFQFVMANNNSTKTLKENNEEEQRLECILDGILIDDFRAKKIKNDNVVFHEVLVEDCIQALETIRFLGDDEYDLVMVGKRHNMGHVTDEEMVNFMDHADQLGIFGDMLASTEFCSGKVPVLVLQCGEKRIK